MHSSVVCCDERKCNPIDRFSRKYLKAGTVKSDAGHSSATSRRE